MNEYFQMYNYGDHVFNTLGVVFDSCFSLRFPSPNMSIQTITFRICFNQLSKKECRWGKIWTSITYFSGSYNLTIKLKTEKSETGIFIVLIMKKKTQKKQ